MRWFLALIAWTYASFLWSVDIRATVAGLRNLISKLLLVFCSCKMPLDRLRLERLGILIAGIVGGLGLIFLAKSWAIRLGYAGRMHELSWSNMIAAALIVAIPLIIFNKPCGLLSLGNLAVALGVSVFTAPLNAALNVRMSLV